jgi:hypothetical protein
MRIRRNTPLAVLASAAVIIAMLNLAWFMWEDWESNSRKPNTTTLRPLPTGLPGGIGGDQGNSSLVAEPPRTERDGRPAEPPRKTHSPSVFLTHPLGMVGGFYLTFAYGLPRALAGPRRGSTVPLPLTGSPVVVGRCGGKIGKTQLSGPLLNVSVYTDRVVLRPLLLDDYTIMAYEISSLRRASSRRWGEHIVIEHFAADIKSPVGLHLAPGKPVRRAIEQLVPPRT